jgi:transposase
LRRERELGRELARLGRETFACRADAREATEAFAAEHLGNHHRLTDMEIIEVLRYGRRGRPAKGAEPKEVRYRIKAHLERDEAAITEDLEHSGRYILATNVLKLKGDELLTEYKGRQSVERGFRFLKEPLFFASSVFVKSPRRVAAIAMVMGLCLLIYALGERFLRRALEESEASIRHQTGKPTQKPTLRWVFQLFQAVHLLSGDGAEQVSNLTEERRSILGFLGQRCQRYYLLR